MALCKPINISKKIGANNKNFKNKADQSNNSSLLSASSEEASSMKRSNKGDV